MPSDRIVFHQEAAVEYEAAAFDWYLERSGLIAAKFAEEVGGA